MSYEDTNCPCGGRKLRETMLCQGCETAFAGTEEMRAFNDPAFGNEHRRSVAIRLLGKARGRRRQLSFNFTTQ